MWKRNMDDVSDGDGKKHRFRLYSEIHDEQHIRRSRRPGMPLDEKLARKAPRKVSPPGGRPPMLTSLDAWSHSSHASADDGRRQLGRSAARPIESTPGEQDFVAAILNERPHSSHAPGNGGES